MKEMGKVMGAASKELGGKADGKEMADLVKKILNSQIGVVSGLGRRAMG